MPTTFIYLGAGSGSGGSSYWGDAVADFASLPAGTQVGEARITQDTLTIYAWDGAAWQTIATLGADVVGPGSAVDGQIVLFDGVTGKLIKAATATGVVKTTAGVYSVGNVSLTSEVTGVLPVANGGTNSSVALNNNRVITSVGGALVEAAAITGNRALSSNASGIPVASATTDTQLGYLSTVTSDVQTQLDGKVNDTGDTVTGPLILTGASTYLGFPRLTTVQRDALIGPQGGWVIFNTDSNRLECFLDAPVSDWVDIIGWGAPVG